MIPTRGSPEQANRITNVLKAYQLASSNALVDERKEPSQNIDDYEVMRQWGMQHMLCDALGDSRIVFSASFRVSMFSQMATHDHRAVKQWETLGFWFALFLNFQGAIHLGAKIFYFRQMGDNYANEDTC